MIVEQLHRIARRTIELVDEGEDRQVVPARHLEQLARLILDAVRRVDDHDDAVGGDQRAVGVLAEVLVARRVDAATCGGPRSSNSSAAEVIEMPRSCSSAIQSEVACRRALRPRTAPASSIAPA